MQPLCGDVGVKWGYKTTLALKTARLLETTTINSIKSKEAGRDKSPGDSIAALGVGERGGGRGVWSFAVLP